MTFNFQLPTFSNTLSNRLSIFYSIQFKYYFFLHFLISFIYSFIYFFSYTFLSTNKSSTIHFSQRKYLLPLAFLLQQILLLQPSIYSCVGCKNSSIYQLLKSFRSSTTFHPKSLRSIWQFWSFGCRFFWVPMVDQEGFQRHRCMLLGRLAKTLCMQPDLVRSASLYIVFLF